MVTLDRILTMAQAKRKTVFTAEPGQVESIRAIVRAGRFRSASEFLRDAIDEKLRRLEREGLVDQVERYCREASLRDEPDLVDAQAFDEES